jgi:oligosaccharyltransferase complex subunit delta (ribophorin II)
MLTLVSLFVLFVTCHAGQSASSPKKPREEPSKAHQPITAISVKNSEFAVFDSQLTKPAKYTSLTFNAKLPNVPSVDSHQKVQLKFNVIDNNNKEITVHQAFVALIHAETGREVVYVAEPDKTSKQYTFELNLNTHSKDFAGVSGKYALRLLLGDAKASNAINWHFGDLLLSVPPTETPAVKKSKQIIYNPLPEIKHEFREQEKRPSILVSDVFTIICATPLLLLLILWLRVGINFGNIQFSLWALGFHVGLGAIFGLYFVFWLKLNAFVAMKYLLLAGVPTFVCGQRLLHGLALDKLRKSVE